MDVVCGREVTDLHVFLQAWLAGTVPRDSATFARFEDVIGDDFLIISPLGIITDRAALLPEFEASHGVLAPQSADFRIWIENYRCVRDMGDRALVVYEEWHGLGDTASARLTTALFERHPATQNGVTWAHVHETWLPGRAPAAGERFPEPAAG